MVEMKLDHIYKRYDDAKEDSVMDFNLEIKDKEFIVFVGPSGCGKSTTLRMIAGLEDITKGDFLIDGKRVNDLPPKDRHIAMVFQNYALYPHMTVYDNMSFGLKIRKHDKEDIDKRVHEAAKITGLEEYLDRKPAALSGGQRQRVALGRAIVRDAPIFLMDEPLSNLDAKLRISMRAEIAKLHRRLNTTTIYVTHDQTEAMTMADRIVVMRDGRIQQVGTPSEVYRKPANVFVGSFIGAPAMNFFKVQLKDGKILNVDGSFEMPLPKGQVNQLVDKGYDEKEIILGIRPEHLHTEPVFLNAFPETTVDVTVSVAELLGSELQLYCKLGSAEIISKIEAREEIKPGDQLKLGFDLNKASYFDVKTQKAIF